MNTLSESAVRDLIKQGENERVEFKTSLRDASALIQNVSALANTHGGTILVGIQEPQIVVGANPIQVMEVVERARKMLIPSIDLGVSTIEIDHRPVIVITVPESPEVVFAGGMALKRVGEQNRPLSSQDITRKVPTPASTEDVKKLADAITKQTQTIEELRQELNDANSLKSKLKDYLIGGVIGAILGAIATALMG